MGATKLTYSEFKAEVAKRLPGVDAKTINKVLGAFTEEVTDCVVNGYAVQVPGLFSIEPVVKAGRKKGTVVRNPFDGTEKTLRGDEPDKFVVKLKKSSSLARKFPTLRTTAGKELHGKLTAKAGKRK